MAAFGIDFGTTNSSLARADDGVSARVAQFARGGGQRTQTFRSVVYFERTPSGRGAPRELAGPRAIARYLAVDLGRVTYISSAGFWALLFAESLLKRARGALVLCGLSEDLARLMERSGLVEILRTTATREDALRVLQAAQPEDAPARPIAGAR